MYPQKIRGDYYIEDLHSCQKFLGSECQHRNPLEISEEGREKMEFEVGNIGLVVKGLKLEGW